MEWNPVLTTRTGESASIIPVDPAWVGAYCHTGIQAYRDHYLQLWQNRDPSPYLEQHFNPEKVVADLDNPSLQHGLLLCRHEMAGIFKLDLGRESGHFYPGEALFIEKIYFKKAFTGMGLGEALIQSLCGYARSIGRRAIWLETMYRGPARPFYLKQGFRYLSDAEVPYSKILPEERAMWVMGREA